MGFVSVRGAAVAVVAVGMVLAGCSSGGGSSEGKASKPASSSPASAAMSPRAAFEAYQEVAASGCTDADDCQAFMTRKLAAADKVRAAMESKDRQMYALPIGYVEAAGRQADHFGRDNLGAKGNSLAVSLPLQRMVAWFREHPEG